MTLIIKGSGLTIKEVVAIARHNEKDTLSQNAKECIIACGSILEKKIEARKIIYVINPGIGEFSEMVLSNDQIKDFQKHLTFNHVSAVSCPIPLEYVRVAIRGGINVKVRENSGNMFLIIHTLVEMLNKGVTPYVRNKGSVGASGDLTPMAQIMLLLIGEGKTYYQGVLLEDKEAMERAGIVIPCLETRDALANINGYNVLTAMSTLFLYYAQKWSQQTEFASPVSLEALKTNMGTYTARLQEDRVFAIAIKSVENLEELVEGGDLKLGEVTHKVQDAYSMRSTPQVVGAAGDALVYADLQVEIEVNGVGDSPIFFPDDNTQLSGTNFQGTALALSMEMAGLAIAMLIVVLSELLMKRLNKPALNAGLSPFLTKSTGMFSGLMRSHYTAYLQMVEHKNLSTTAPVNQEDHVSMGMNTAIKNFQIIDNAYGIIEIELMAVAQPFDFCSYHFGKGVQAAHDIVKKYVDFIKIDHPLYHDHNTMKALVKLVEKINAFENVLKTLF